MLPLLFFFFFFCLSPSKVPAGHSMRLQKILHVSSGLHWEVLCPIGLLFILLSPAFGICDWWKLQYLLFCFLCTQSVPGCSVSSINRLLLWCGLTSAFPSITAWLNIKHKILLTSATPLNNCSVMNQWFLCFLLGAHDDFDAFPSLGAEGEETRMRVGLDVVCGCLAITARLCVSSAGVGYSAKWTTASYNRRWVPVSFSSITSPTCIHIPLGFSVITPSAPWD